MPAMTTTMIRGSWGRAQQWVWLGAALALVGCKTAETQQRLAKATVAPAPPAPPRAEDDFERGLKAFDAGQWSEAEASFSSALSRAPHMVNAQYNLGVVYERQGLLGKAEKAYQAAHALNPSHSPTLLNLGKVYRLQDKFNEAIALYEQALKIPGREHDVQLLNNLTVAYRLAKRYPEAEAAARKVLARTKDNADAYKNLALIYYDQGNYRLAEFVSANARKLDDKDAGVYNNLGMIYLKMDERARALGQFQKAVTLNDRFAPGYMNIGAMALTYRDYETAEKSYSKAVALEPASYEAHLYYGYALDGQKGRDPKKGLAAGQAFEKVLTLRPDHPEAVCGAGWAYSVDKGGWSKAVNYLEKCRTLVAANLQEAQAVDVKLKSLAAMQKSGQAQAGSAPKKDAPKKEGNGPSLLDKVSEEAAEAEPNTAAPANGNEQAPAQKR